MNIQGVVERPYLRIPNSRHSPLRPLNLTWTTSTKGHHNSQLQLFFHPLQNINLPDHLHVNIIISYHKSPSSREAASPKETLMNDELTAFSKRRIWHPVSVRVLVIIDPFLKKAAFQLSFSGDTLWFQPPLGAETTRKPPLVLLCRVRVRSKATRSAYIEVPNGKTSKGYTPEV